MGRARPRFKASKPPAAEPSSSSRPVATRRAHADWSIWRPHYWQGLVLLLVVSAGCLCFLPILHARRGHPVQDEPTVAAREEVGGKDEIAAQEFYVVSAQDAPGTGTVDQSQSSGPHLYTFKVVKAYPHDPSAFTQGLLYSGNETFYESTGLHGRSSVREVDLATGQVLQRTDNPRSVFGEGLALWKERLLQISWQTQEGYEYDRRTLKLLRSFKHPMKDGWGLTSNASVLFGTDGSSNLFVLNPDTYKELDRKVVKDGSRSVRNLNELEHINGHILANIWLTDCIAQISPLTGRVTAWLHMPTLREIAFQASNGKRMDVLNGIAWDSESRRLFVTGKLWPQIYEIKLQMIANPTAQELQAVRSSCIPKQRD